ncbi:EndoU domain-containing protein [Clostridium botulinum]|nr:EndoU domain-containing protein [Clostridium botulinum]MBY6819207.1 EndoU domain-containing protein [Clostridium botulinum]
MLFKVLLSLSILGSNVMLNVVMQNDKINKMPKTYKGIPMSGSDLEKRMDIATFDATKKYKEGTMVKFKSLDGEYILGEAGKSAPCAGGVSAFKAYDKSSYKGHNSPKDAIKSMGYGALDFVNTSLDSTSDLAFDACKYVMTRGIIDESTNNKIGNSFDWLKEQKGKPSDLLHEHFKNESPHKETFEATKIGLDMLTLLDSGIGAASYCGKLSKIKKLNAAEKVANSKKAENILNELNKEILGVNKGSAGANKSLPTKIPYEFMNDTVDHIFKGVTKNAGTANACAGGWHYIGSDIPKGNKIIEVTRAADKFGTIEAEVEIGGVAKDGISTFFNNKYTQNEVVDMIMQAHMNKKSVPGSKGRYIGVADNGMTIEMYLYRNAEKCNTSDIITAYPVHVDTLK